MDDTQEELFEEELYKIYTRFCHEFHHRMIEALDDEERGILGRAYLSASISFFMVVAAASGSMEYVDCAIEYLKLSKESCGNKQG